MPLAQSSVILRLRGKTLTKDDEKVIPVFPRGFTIAQSYRSSVLPSILGLAVQRAALEQRCRAKKLLRMEGTVF
jgi:hypothetical protein